MAVANLLNVRTKNVILRFAMMALRVLQSQESVLVSVSLVNVQGSIGDYISMVTQENINYHMAAEGLKSVELIRNTSGNSTSQGIY